MRAEVVIPTAELVTAVVLILGIVGPLVGIGAVAWKVSKRFRPAFQAQIDPKRQAIRLDARNKGRASGQVRLVAVVDPGGAEYPAQFAGLPGGRFHSAWLGGQENRHLIIAANESSGAFPPEVGVRAEWGKDGEEVLPPVPFSHPIHGLESNWPPPGSGRDAD